MAGMAGLMPRRRAIIIRQVMILATSIPCGQRVVQTWHDAHSQMVLEERISSCPNWMARMIWLGV